MAKCRGRIEDLERQHSGEVINILMTVQGAIWLLRKLTSYSTLCGCRTKRSFVRRSDGEMHVLRVALSPSKVLAQILDFSSTTFGENRNTLWSTLALGQNLVDS